MKNSFDIVAKQIDYVGSFLNIIQNFLRGISSNFDFIIFETFRNKFILTLFLSGSNETS